MTPEETRTLLETIQHQARGLSPWEETFVESVSEQFDRKGKLSEKQIEILLRIQDEKVSIQCWKKDR